MSAGSAFGSTMRTNSFHSDDRRSSGALRSASCCLRGANVGPRGTSVGCPRRREADRNAVAAVCPGSLRAPGGLRPLRLSPTPIPLIEVQRYARYGPRTHSRKGPKRSAGRYPGPLLPPWSQTAAWRRSARFHDATPCTQTHRTDSTRARGRLAVVGSRRDRLTGANAGACRTARRDWAWASHCSHPVTGRKFAHSRPSTPQHAFRTIPVCRSYTAQCQ